MDEAHEPDPMDQLPRVFGYARCYDCGTVVLQATANQQHGRCTPCWKDRSPLATLEVIQESVRYAARRAKRHYPRKKPDRKGEAPAWNARYSAYIRLANLFPDVF